MAAGEPTPSDGERPSPRAPDPAPAATRGARPARRTAAVLAVDRSGDHRGRVGLASGEFILFPYIASQVGLVFVWAALVGLLTQFVLNMEIERYTLATGETALTGFSRYWRHWGLVFAILTYFANLWPGWATSSATLVTYLFGGDRAVIADRHAAGDRAGADVGAGRLRGAGTGPDAQGRRGGVAVPGRRRVRDRCRRLGRPAAGGDQPAASRPPSSASRCCSARWPSPARAAVRTWCSPTGSGTRASGWAATCRAWSARSPASRRRRRAPGTSSPPPTRTWGAGAAGGSSPTSSS